ncbi:hypothetical protein EAS62_30085 [Bradyrhizobium zhanjiangense]|uniref:Uncharacterized protein n=1 Tax=Bradyrhizobium zhanjiangense TaxID=1325107 RepID=A0ABY0DD72_9BRAD|nr:hypothetical protein EAS62_30085 [Bradyrhizobium zhanjiangense]
MEQIQQKGSRDGNAIFAQMPDRRAAAAPFTPVAFADETVDNVKPAVIGRLDPRRDFAKECLPRSRRKDPM